MVKEKLCSKCRVLKHSSEFYKRKLLKCGLSSWCKECTEILGKATKARYREQNKEADYKGYKYCGKCGKRKPKTRFHRNRTTKDGLEWSCKLCHLDKQMRIRTGIVREDKKRVFHEQNGKCAICGKTARSFKGLRVDHCHDTKKFRGLLCHFCNVGLGHFKHDPEILKKAVEYLGKH